MSSIIGFKGNFKFESLISMVNIISHRGMDCTGLYLEDNSGSFFDDCVDFDSLNFNDVNVAFASNYSLFDDLQPCVFKDLVLVFDGCLYNKDEICEYLGSNTSSCSLLLLEFISFELESKGIVDALTFVMNFISGDYCFALLYKGDVLLARDGIGVKPLFYSDVDDGLVFASEAKALKLNGFSDVCSLTPACFYYKGEEFKAFDIFSDLDKFDDDYDVLVDNLISVLYNTGFGGKGQLIVEFPKKIHF